MHANPDVGKYASRYLVNISIELSTRNSNNLVAKYILSYLVFPLYSGSNSYGRSTEKLKSVTSGVNE